MKFLPRETCEALVKMGCKSNSGYWWSITAHQTKPDGSSEPVINLSHVGYKDDTEAFTPFDFLDDDQAIKNCLILFGNDNHNDSTHLRARHALLDALDQIAFLAEAVLSGYVSESRK